MRIHNNKLGKQILSLLMALVMVVSMLPMSSFTAFAAEGDACASTTDCTGTYANGVCSVCGGYQPAVLTTDKYDVNGDEVMDEVYEISNAGQLYWFTGLRRWLAVATAMLHKIGRLMRC